MDYSDLILKLVNKVTELEKRIQNLENELSFNKEKNVPDANLSYHSTESLNLRIRNEIPIEKPQRDKTRYLFNGNVYLKNKLVLAVVSDYVRNYPTITRDELLAKFPKSLQGSLGVVEYAEVAMQRKDYDVRFFTKENDIIALTDGNMYVCSQWGILNIPRFVRYANEYLGYDIKELN